MQRERTRTGQHGIAGRYLVTGVILLGAAGIAVPLTVLSGSPGSSGSSGGASARHAAVAKALPSLSVASFTGYTHQPGLPGAPKLEVNAIASAGGLRLAVGSAGGYPAIWRQGPGGAWTLVTSPDSLPAGSAPATLTGIAHGAAGWLAVGPGPVILTSADGVT